MTDAGGKGGKPRSKILAHVVLVAARLICGEFGRKLGLQLVMGEGRRRDGEKEWTVSLSQPHKNFGSESVVLGELLRNEPFNHSPSPPPRSLSVLAQVLLLSLWALCCIYFYSLPRAYVNLMLPQVVPSLTVFKGEPRPSRPPPPFVSGALGMFGSSPVLRSRHGVLRWYFAGASLGLHWGFTRLSLVFAGHKGVST